MTSILDAIKAANQLLTYTKPSELSERELMLAQALLELGTRVELYIATCPDAKQREEMHVKLLDRRPANPRPQPLRSDFDK